MRNFINIVEGRTKDHHRAVSCINQILDGSEATEDNCERLRHDMEVLVMDAIHYGKWEQEDASALERIRKTLADAITQARSAKLETVNNMKEMLRRFS